MDPCIASVGNLQTLLVTHQQQKPPDFIHFSRSAEPERHQCSTELSNWRTLSDPRMFEYPVNGLCRQHLCRARARVTFHILEKFILNLVHSVVFKPAASNPAGEQI